MAFAEQELATFLSNTRWNSIKQIASSGIRLETHCSLPPNASDLGGQSRIAFIKWFRFVESPSTICYDQQM